MPNDTHQIISELLHTIDSFRTDVEERLVGKKHKKVRKSVLSHIDKIETKLEDHQYNTDVGDE